MDEITFKHLHEIAEQDLVDLMNNPEVGKHLPLLTGAFSLEDCRAFLKAKKQLWDTYGFGPWAFLIKGEFAGWGGLQPEQGEADFALILHPKFWGWGRKIFKKVADRAFQEMAIPSITILLPPTRPNARAILRAGFLEEGETIVKGARFLKFRLSKPETLS